MKQIPFDPVHVPLDGTHLIEASAGTGKTYTIANLVVRLIIEKNLLINKILIVTFTEAATSELRERVHNRLQEALEALTTAPTNDTILTNLLEKVADQPQIAMRLKNALRSFDEAAIYTIHSFCSHTLRDHAFESGILFKHQLLQDQMPLLLETVQDFWRNYLYSQSQLFISYLNKSAKKFSEPKKLIDILGKGRYIAQPEKLLHILPKENTVTEYSILEQEVKEKILEIYSLWQQDGKKLHKLLLDKTQQKILDGRTYKVASIDKLCQHMDVSAAISAPALPEKSHLLGTESILFKKAAQSDPDLKHPFFAKMQDVVQRNQSLNENYEQLLVWLKQQLFHYVREHLTHKKQLRNLQSFDDLILNVYQALQKRNAQQLIHALCQKYQVVLIDEFQDTDPMQYQIFNQLFQHKDHSLFLIGDPKQAIYSFRGADIFAYLQANENIEQNCVHTLDINYRSEPHLVTAINTIFQQRSDIPFLIDKIHFHPVQSSLQNKNKQLLLCHQPLAPFKIWYLSQDNLEATHLEQKYWESRYIPNGVAYEIAELLNFSKKNQLTLEDRAVVAGDIAILVRNHNQAHFIQNRLIKLDIPSVLYSHESLFVTREIIEIERILQAIANPTVESWVKAALATDMFGISAPELYEIGEHETCWQNWLTQFQRYHSIWQNVGFIAMFRELLVEKKISSRLLRYPNGERRLTNVLHAGELLHRVAVEQKLGINALCYWLAKQRELAEEVQDEERMLRLESDEMRVKIVTIHKSKGLEYPIVFCPFLWSGRLTDYSDKPLLFHDENKQVTLDLATKHEQNYLNQATLEEKSENLRLLYVALTRAKSRCYVVWGQLEKLKKSSTAQSSEKSQKSGTSRNSVNKLENSPLSYIFHPHRDFSQPIEDETLLSDLDKLVAASKDESSQQYTIEVTTHFPTEFNRYQRFSEAATVLKARNFSGTVQKNWKVTSFSSLIAKRDSECPDYDEATQGIIAEKAGDEILNFPGGAKTGILIHKLLELSDFSQNNSEGITKIFSEQLQQHSFDESWLNIFLQLYRNIVQTRLQHIGELSLSQIKWDKRLNELEFFFPLTEIDAEGLHQIFAKYARNNVLLNRVIQLDFESVRGLMKGFIDMVFEYQNKFYLVDYKSNWLGNQQVAYQIDNLQNIMVQEHYILQYHIYCVALDQYLQLRLPNYRYQEHFGGVFYLFVRGMCPEWGADYGVFYDRPEPEFIAALTRYLTKSKIN